MRYLIVVLGLLALMLAPMAVAAGHAPSLDGATEAHGHDHGSTSAGDAAAQSHGAQVHGSSDHDHPLTALLPHDQAQVVPGVIARWHFAQARRGEAAAKGPLRPPRVMSARYLFG